MKMITVLFAVLIVTAGGYVYFSDAAVFDGFYSEQEQQAREGHRFVKELPKTIGSYQLDGHYSNNIDITRDCTVINGSTICEKMFGTEYRETGGDHAVFVHFIVAESNADILRAYLEKEVQPEAHELLWLPNEKYDAIVAQEARYKFNDRGTVDYQYPDTASANNPVILYFRSAYPSNH
jgi:hypothetical protein